ncbi:MAG TPA: ADOP family duplicated permease [Thermoanaerobaculia bacterium]|nr:ADOP family duplicated permease [Thermoanaerobaculia bacterium]
MSGRRFSPSDWSDPRDEERIESALDDELSFHFTRTVEELRAAGRSEEQARAEAERRFGDLESYRSELARIDRERVASRRREATMEILPSILRHSLRELRRAPGFTLGVVLTLALGIGANAVTFSLVDRLLLSGPSGIEDAERVRAVYVDREWNDSRVVDDTLAYLDVLDLKKAGSLAGVAMETRTDVRLGRGPAASTVRAALVSHEYFPLLGVEPALGRFYGPAEDRVGGELVAVLGHAFWRSHHGADPNVVGSELEVGDRSYTIVGVAPAGFTGTSVARIDLFLPLRSAAHEVVSGEWSTNRGFLWLHAVVRLGEDVAVEQAEAEASLLHRQGRADDAGYDAEARVLLLPLVRSSGPGVAGEIQVAALLAVVALAVLLVATANVANLLLARSLRRRREHAVRLALGVGRRRLLLEKATEGVLLGLLGGVVAILFAVWAGGLLRAALFPWVDWDDADLLGRTIVFVALVSIAAGAVAALIPAGQASVGDLSRWLQSGARRVAGGRSRLRSGLQVLQAALSVILLVGAGLFVRSLDRVRNVDVGIQTEGLISVGLERWDRIGNEEGPGIEEAERFALELEDRLRRLPGVAAVSSSLGSAPFGGAWAIGLRVPGIEERPRFETGGPYVHAVTPGYFETVGTTILRGRGITADDRLGTPRVALVNETMARVYWPGEDPIGKCLIVDVETGEDAPPEPPCSEVVGVVENVRRFSIFEGESGLYYVPRAQRQFDSRASIGRLFVRARDPGPRAMAELAESLRREIMAFAPDLRALRVQSLEERISPQLRSWRLGAALFSAFGALALVVAAVGLYSVLSFEVAGRRHEIGVRSALGASRAALLRQVVREGVTVVALGVVVGSVAALLLAPVIRSQLYGVEPTDPVSHGVVVLVLLAVAALASWVPARRATRVPPTEALRTE